MVRNPTREEAWTIPPVKSALKKWNDEGYAAGVDRKVLEKDAALMEVPLDQLIADTTEGMKTVAESIGLKGSSKQPEGLIRQSVHFYSRRVSRWRVPPHRCASRLPCPLFSGHRTVPSPPRVPGIASSPSVPLESGSPPPYGLPNRDTTSSYGESLPPILSRQKECLVTTGTNSHTEPIRHGKP